MSPKRKMLLVREKMPSCRHPVFVCTVGSACICLYRLSKTLEHVGFDSIKLILLYQAPLQRFYSASRPMGMQIVCVREAGMTVRASQ